MDNISAKTRSAIMSRVRSRHTSPELAVRKMLHADGFRYRLHCAALPGKPDLVFSKAKVALFVHGCFWHLHERCANARMPKSRIDYWRPKLRGNRRRDRLAQRKLEALGWTVVVVWECELAEPETVRRRLARRLRTRSGAR